MVRQSGIWDIEFFLYLADDEPIGMSGQEELHDAEPGLGAHGGEHVGIPGDLLGGFLGSDPNHISIIAETWVNWQGQTVAPHVDGGQPRKMLPIPLSVSLSAGIRWSPDGRQLTYVNRGKDGDDIWSFRLNDGALHQITHFHGVVVIGFDWSPDGKELVFSRGVQTREVVLIEDAGQK